MPLNRVVVLLTPFFTLVSAVCAGWLAKHFPGLPTPSSDQILAVEIAGFSTALASALAWLRGHHIELALGEPGDPDGLPDVPTVAVVPADEGDIAA